MSRLPILRTATTTDALTDAFEAFVSVVGPTCRMSADELLAEIQAGTVKLPPSGPALTPVIDWLEAFNEAWEQAEDAEDRA